MEPRRERAGLVGVTLAVVAVVAVLGIVAAFVWAAVKGEAAVVTAGTALIVFAVGEFFSRRRAAQQYRWDRIGPTYEAFVKQVRALGNDPQNAELRTRAVEFMADFGDMLLLWGAPDVVRAWTASLRLDHEEAGEIATTLAHAKVLLAIRKDLGHGDPTLEARDLLRVTINDIDEYLPPGTRV